VINNTQAPAYKITKYINKKMHHLINLPNNYNAKNSYEIAEELNKIQINENSRIITLDIKDLYVNLSPVYTNALYPWRSNHGATG